MAYDEYPPPNWRCSPSLENVANREGHGVKNREGHGIVKYMEVQIGNFSKYISFSIQGITD